MPRSNLEVYWDEFCDWCCDSGIGDPRHTSEDEDRWRPWFACWEAALDACEEPDDE